MRIQVVLLCICLMIIWEVHSCQTNKTHILNCLDSNDSILDLNGDERLDRYEISHMFKHLNFAERMLASAVGGVDFVFRLCDLDQDGFIEKSDLLLETCLSSCWSITRFEQLVCF